MYRSNITSIHLQTFKKKNFSINLRQKVFETKYIKVFLGKFSSSNK